MTRTAVALTMILGVITTSSVTQAKPKGSTMTDGALTFAARLHGRLEGRAGNLFYSPASIRIALAMAEAGARGQTAVEMQAALELSPGKATHTGFAALLNAWAALGHPLDDDSAARAANNPEMQRYYESELAQRRIVLHMVNRLWGQSGYRFHPDYLALLRDAYRAPLAQLDFKKSPEPSRVAINRWVSDATEHKIPNLMPPESVTSDTRLVLTNAVYFKATWQAKFEREDTRDAPFFIAGGHPVEAPMMHQVHYFSIGSFDGGQILELPYGSGEMVMDVVLPAKKDGIAHIEKQYAEGALRRWLGTLKSERVDVALPRFRLSSSFELARTLSALGMPLAFKYPGADFSGMDGSHDLFVGSVIHQAFVDVDENGTEAAAATAVGMLAGAAMPTARPTPFHADHPFLFLIRDPVHDVVLFAGRLSNPAAS